MKTPSALKFLVRIACPVVILVWGLCGTILRAQQAATVSDASAVIDLSKFKLPEEADPNATRHLASTLYYSKAAPDASFEYVKKELIASGWKEMPGSYAAPQFASGMFEKNGFRLSASTTQVTGDKSGPKTMVSINNQGNVMAKDIKLSENYRSQFSGEVSAMYVSPDPRDVVAQACRDTLVKAGWEPFGSAGEQMFFKKNAIRLSLYVTTAPAQQNQTSISVSSEMMSVDLPAPTEADQVEYAESTTTLSFESSKTSEQLFAFYRDRLAQEGWQATTDNPIKERLGDSLIFRNQAEDMLTLEIQEFDKSRRGQLRHQSAEELADMERLLKEEKAKSGSGK